MVVIITGASHTGKTTLAQRMLEKYQFPYYSIDHLKMGLIRSHQTELTPLSEDADLTDYLWPIVCEMIKTAIENGQNLIVEGCYVPLDWRKYFAEYYHPHIRLYCLIMSERYVHTHFSDIKAYASVSERRLDDSACTKASLLEDNAWYLEQAQRYGVEQILIDSTYAPDITL